MATPALSNAKDMAMTRIERIELFPMRYPMKGYFKFFTGPHGGDGRAAVIIKMTADNGTVGWGQSVPIAKWSYETLETATIALRDYYAPALLGHNPLDIEGAHALMDKAIAPGFTTGMPITRAGIDIALHDLSGKLKGQSLAQMWGKTPGGPIKLSWTVNVKKLDDIDRVMEEGRKQGYRNFNIKVAPDPAFDVELARRVKKNAPDGFLWADANGGYDPKTALDAAPKLADAGVDILEAPIKPNRISGFQAPSIPGVCVPAPYIETFRGEKLRHGKPLEPPAADNFISKFHEVQRSGQNRPTPPGNLPFQKRTGQQAVAFE
jgi:L-alanine-DL-glutamate epimerase-like enolase superfamily enzyme